MTFAFPFKINADPNSGIPELEGIFGRINVVLGANGAGKTKLLQQLLPNRERIFPGFSSTVCVEGGRALEIDVNVAVSQNSLHIFTHPETAERQHSQQNALSQRLKQTFVLINSLQAKDKAAFADEVMDWQKGGSSGTCPIPNEFRFDEYLEKRKMYGLILKEKNETSIKKYIEKANIGLRFGIERQFRNPPQKSHGRLGAPT